MRDASADPLMLRPDGAESQTADQSNAGHAEKNGLKGEFFSGLLVAKPDGGAREMLGINDKLLNLLTERSLTIDGFMNASILTADRGKASSDNDALLMRSRFFIQATPR